MPEKNENTIYDVAIVGASLDGIDAYNALRRRKIRNIVVVSKSFDKVSSGRSVLKADRITGEVALSSYRNGLLVLTLTDGSRICCKNAIIATGSKPKRKAELEGAPNVFYRPDCVKLRNKDAPVVVVGDNKQTAEFALELAKRYNYIYICCPSQRLHCGKEDGLEVYWAKNIAFLPLCNITLYKTTKSGRLSEVVLDTCERIKCGAVLVSAEKTPDVSCVSKPLVEFDEDGRIKTDGVRVTTAPNVFAVGECKSNPSREDAESVADAIASIGGYDNA